MAKNKNKYVVIIRYARDGSPSSDDQELGRYVTIAAAEAAIRTDVMNDFMETPDIEGLGKQNYAAWYSILKVEEIKTVRPDIWIKAEVRMEVADKTRESKHAPRKK